MLLALGAGFAVAWALWTRVPEQLEVRTDIVGYPIFADFNGRLWIVGYLLLVVVLPLAAIAAWAALGRLRPFRTARVVARPPREAPPEEPAPGSGLRVVAALARLAGVGAIWALALAVLIEADAGSMLGLVASIAAAYTGAIALGVSLLGRREPEAWIAAVARVNAVSASFLVLGVAAASIASHVVVTDTETEVAYPLVSDWVAVAVAVAVGILVTRTLGRGGPAGWLLAERRVVLWLALPVALYLMLAELPEALGTPDYFHDGERMTAMDLVREGAFPWRDIVSVHGVLEDVLWPLFGTSIYGDSRWAWVAGQEMVSNPLFWITTFLLCVYLFGRSWQFVIGIFCLIVLGWLPGLGTERLVLVPVTLLLLAAVLARPTWPRVVAFMAVSIANPILIPETILFSGSAWLVVLLYELLGRQRGASLASALTRTLRCAAAGTAIGLAIVVYLAANHALDDFVGFFVEFTGGHDLTGAFPIQWEGTQHPTSFRFWVFAPIVAVLATWGFVAWKAARREALTVAEWVALAAALPIVPYYTRFLARADDHLYLLASAAFVPVCYLAFRLFEGLDALASGATRRRLGRRPLTTVGLVALIALAPLSATEELEEVPQRYEATAAEEPELARMGYTRPGSTDSKLIADMRRVLERHLPPGGQFFDFTNSPELFGYFLDADLATRYYHVSTAIRESTQEDLISELDEEAPDLIAYNSEQYGLPVWDQIANPVRHYLVSDWLLERYSPVARVDGYLFMAPSDQAPRSDRDVLARGRGCDWRHAPSFLETSHGPSGAGQSASLSDQVATRAVTTYGWALDPSGTSRAQSVLVAVGDRVIEVLPTGIPRPDVATEGALGVQDSGFGGRDIVLPSGADPATVGFFALGEESARPIAPVPATQIPQALDWPGHGTVAVDAQPAEGSVDAFDVNEYVTYRLRLPAQTAELDWLELTTSAPMGDAQVLISDRNRFEPSGDGDYRRAISFNSRAEDEASSLEVMVGACPQWHAWAARDVVLRTQGDIEIDAITLRK